MKTRKHWRALCKGGLPIPDENVVTDCMPSLWVVAAGGFGNVSVDTSDLTSRQQSMHADLSG